MEGETYRLLPTPPTTNLAVANALRTLYSLAAAFRLI